MSTASDVTQPAPSRWKAVGELLGQYRLHVTLLVLASFTAGMIEAAFLVAATRTGLAIANNVEVVELTRGITLTVGEALVVAGSLIAVRMVVTLLDVRVQTGLAYRVATGLRKQMARAFLDASWAVQQAQPAGTLQQVVVTFPNRASELLGTLTGAGGAALSLVALLTMAVVVDAQATLVVLAALVVLSVVLGPLRRRILGRASTAVQHELLFANQVAEVSALGLEIQAFGTKAAVDARLEHAIDRNAASQRSVRLLAGSLSPVYVSLAYAAVILALAAVTALGTSNLDSVGAVMLVMLRSLGYGQMLQSGSSAASQIAPFLTQVRETLGSFTQTPPTWGSVVPSAVTPLEFRNVSFGYVPSRPVLRDFNLHIHKGEILGITGASGAGKSTLVQLLLGLRRPDSGQIFVAGAPFTDIDRSWWSERVAFVPQEAQLITGSVADNIRFFREKITDEKLEHAARAAHIWGEICAMPNGLSTHLGERGQQLSGGQRQRLCIARALVGVPELLVLDEPTSALDEFSEAAIRNSLHELKGSVTIVVVAHRPTTLEVCSRTLTVRGA